MQLRLLTLLTTTCLFVCCNNQPQQKDDNNDTAGTINPKHVTCYSYTNNNDTIKLTTVEIDGSITGTLFYHYNGKDRNTGTIQGAIKNDMLIADYSFMSEGVTSIRQVAFKKDGDNFIEGYGDMEEKNGVTVFKNIDSLSYNDSFILRPVACE